MRGPRERMYILNGRTPVPCADSQLWGRWMELPKVRVVAQTDVRGIFVSTVFLGLDHQWGEGPPLLFETVLFASRSNKQDLDSDRYATWEEALAGHARMVAQAEGLSRSWKFRFSQFVDGLRRKWRSA